MGNALQLTGGTEVNETAKFVLRRLLKNFYKARKSHRTIDSIDTCLASGVVIELMKLRISENDKDQLKGTYYDTSNSKLPLRMEHLELVLLFSICQCH